MSFQIVALVTGKDQPYELIEKYLVMWGKFYKNFYPFFRQL